MATSERDKRSIIEEIEDTMSGRDRKQLEARYEETKRMLPAFKEQVASIFRKHLPSNETSYPSAVEFSNVDRGTHLTGTIQNREGRPITISMHIDKYPYEGTALTSLIISPGYYRSLSIDGSRVTLVSAILGLSHYYGVTPEELGRFSELLGVLDTRGTDFRGDTPRVLGPVNSQLSMLGA